MLSSTQFVKTVVTLKPQIQLGNDKTSDFAVLLAGRLFDNPSVDEFKLLLRLLGLERCKLGNGVTLFADGHLDNALLV